MNATCNRPQGNRMRADDPRHGTLNGYRNLGCRCDDCRRANAEWQRNYMARSPEVRERRNARRRVGYKNTRATDSATIAAQLSGGGDAQTSRHLADTYDEVTT